MLFTFLMFLVLCLAVSGFAHAWFLEDGIFAPVITSIVMWAVPTAAEEAHPTWNSWGRDKLAELVTCHTCMTFHIAFWLAVLFFLPGFFITSMAWRCVLHMPLFILAAARIALLIDHAVEAGDREHDT